MQVLLDYFFNITSIVPTSAASTAFLKQVCVVANPNAGGTEGDITLCTTTAEVAAVTDNTEINELFSAGLARVYVLQASSLDLDAILDANQNLFYTLLISSDFGDTDVDGADFGTYEGVIGHASNDNAWLKAFAATEKRCAFYRNGEGAKNMIYAFGKLLANQLSWANQQYVTMPYDSEVTTTGAAQTFFDDRVSFVITDGQYGKRLAFFAAGGKAIVAPYITKNLEIDLQSRGLTYISGNQPDYSIKHATLLEEELNQVVRDYVDRGWIEGGIAEVKLEEANFIASCYINTTEPKGLWRVNGQSKQTYEA